MAVKTYRLTQARQQAINELKRITTNKNRQITREVKANVEVLKLKVVGEPDRVPKYDYNNMTTQQIKKLTREVKRTDVRAYTQNVEYKHQKSTTKLSHEKTTELRKNVQGENRSIRLYNKKYGTDNPILQNPFNRVGRKKSIKYKKLWTFEETVKRIEEYDGENIKSYEQKQVDAWMKALNSEIPMAPEQLQEITQGIEVLGHKNFIEMMEDESLGIRKPQDFYRMAIGDRDTEAKVIAEKLRLNVDKLRELGQLPKQVKPKKLKKGKKQKRKEKATPKKR